MADKNNDNKMSREEAGRLGGEATSKSHGKEFYEEIGEKGGENSHSGGNNSDGNNSGGNKMSREEAGRKGGKNSHNGGNNS